MKIKATFIGRVSSLGYIPGERYELLVKDTLGSAIRRIDNTGFCPYESFSAFFQNWSNISVIPTHPQEQRELKRIEVLSQFTERMRKEHWNKDASFNIIIELLARDTDPYAIIENLLTIQKGQLQTMIEMANSSHRIPANNV